MGKHLVRIRLLSLITVVTLVAGTTAISAVAAGPAGANTAVNAVPAGPTRAATAASSLAPCTAPLFGPDKDCESTSPTVDRWWDAGAAASSCTVTWTIDWGDGSQIWTGTFVDESPGQHLLASHTYKANVFTTYTETVTSSIVSGPCSGAATYTFKFTHLPYATPSAAVQPWWAEYGITKACAEDLVPNPVTVGLGLLTLGSVLGVYTLPTTPWLAVLTFASASYRVFKLTHDCGPQNYPLIPIVHAFDYGASHPGMPFKPSGTVPQPPRITGIYGYQKGVLDYFSLTYADPDHDAKGFGFVGINGARWAEENHPFSSPSYGIVGNDRIDYPFNLACGTPQEYKSWVEAWIYDSQGIRSNPVEIALSCAT